MMKKRIVPIFLVVLVLVTVLLPATVNAKAGTNTLNAGESLQRGESLISNNGLYRLVLQDDGNLVVYKSSNALWASGTDGKAVKNCIMQTDGNLVLYGYNGLAVWASNTNGVGNASSYLIMQDDGNLVMYKKNPIWASNTWATGFPDKNDPNNKDYLNPNEQLLRGESIKSDNGLFTLIHQDDGNLVLYNKSGSPLWASGTDGIAVKNCIMQSDGNLVLYRHNGTAVWSSGTYNHPNSMLIVQNDGNAVIYENSAFWATGTNQ